MPLTPQGYSLGWNPIQAARSRAALIMTRQFARVAPGQTQATPDAYSLSKYLLRKMEQGRAGTCWDHAGVCLAETTANALGYSAFPICRRLVGYVGKQLEGGGNPSDGGAVSDALAAMTAERGAGIAHEDLCPYTDDYGTLGTKPPENVYADAKATHLVVPVDVQSDDDAMVMIASNHAVSIGTWWPFNFDDHQAVMSSIGSGTYGHALTKIGYVKPGVIRSSGLEKGAFQWRNWHGQRYPPLPPDIAAQIPGYKSDTPTTTSDFWVPLDLDARLQGMGNYEYISATDLIGLAQNIVITNFDGAFV